MLVIQWAGGWQTHYLRTQPNGWMDDRECELAIDKQSDILNDCIIKNERDNGKPFDIELLNITKGIPARVIERWKIKYRKKGKIE